MGSTPAGEPNGTPKNKTTKGNIPRADADFNSVVKEVSVAWAANPWLTLQWVTAADFTIAATAYNETLEKRSSSGATRPQITAGLKKADKDINNNIKYLKNYLADKYGKKEAVSYYANFGIVHYKGNYEIPTDHNNRKEALKLLLSAIVKEGFDTQKYGLAFWTEISTRYNDFLALSTATDGTVSSGVSNKNQLKKDLKKALNSLVLVIKGNFPDTYQAELRSWGFQKEKY
jgi:hypothetical protein